MGLETGAITAIMLGLSAAGAAGGAAVGVTTAVQQRKNAKEQSANLRQAQTAQQQQLANQRQLERRKNETQAHQVNARLRVLAGESGLAMGGSLDDLARQVDYDRGLNEEIGRMNLGNALNALSSQVSAQQGQIAAGRQSPILGGLLGGFGGLNAGLSLGNSIGTLSKP